MSDTEAAGPRSVTLRSESSPGRRHYMWAYIDDDGALHVDLEDVDPGLDRFFGKEEVEVLQIVRPEHLDRLVELLGAAPGCDLLGFLADHYSGEGSYRLQAVLRGGEVPVERHVF